MKDRPLIFGQVTHKIVTLRLEYHDSKYKSIKVSINVSSLEITEIDNGHRQSSEVMR